MSLIDAAERFAAMDHSAIELEASRCLHSLDRKSACEGCFAVCPVGAITVGKPPSLDSKKCESCLACLASCPVGAFTADDSVPALLNATAHLETPIVELLCSRNPQPDKGLSENSTGIRVKGCLAGLGTGAYVSLAPFSLEHVVLRTEACAACQWAFLRPQIDVQVARAGHFLAAWNKTGSLATSDATEGLVQRPVWNADNPPLSRRDLFRMVARQGQVAMARAMQNGVRTIGRRPGRDRLRVLGAVSHLPGPEQATGVRMGELGFATVSIAEACSACAACARACPTEALQFQKDDEETKFSLKFSPRLCVGCDLCTRVCVPLAVAVNHEPSFDEVFGSENVLLLEGGLIKCARCGAPTAKRDDGDLCDLCEFRQTHPFGSMLPTGFDRSPSGAEKQQP